MDSKTENKFGLWTLTFLVIANMIGAGVFTTSGFAMGDLHSPFWIVIAWVVAGLIAITGAISYGKLIQQIPESGGEYVFLARSVHPVFGFIAGWTSMFAGFTAAISFAALTFEAYAVPESWKEVLPGGSIAIGVIVVAALLHGIKVQLGAGTQNVAVLMKLALLFTFLMIACFQLKPGSVENNLEPVQGTNLALAFCRQLMWMSLSYLGFNAAVYIADEVPNAKKIIPRSLLLGTGIVVVLYVALNFVFVYSADAEVVEASGPTVAAMAAENLGGASFKYLFTTIILIALFTSVTSMMMAAPRVYAKMADHGMLPSFLKFQKDTPLFAIVFQAVLASIIVKFTSLSDLLSYLGVTLSLCAAGSVCTLFLRVNRGGRSIFSSYYIAPLIYVLGTFLAVVMTYFYNQNSGGNYSLIATAATFATGGILYGVKVAVSGPPINLEREPTKPDGKSEK